MRELQTEGARPAFTREEIKTAQQLATELYKRAMESTPGEIADQLFKHAADVSDPEIRALMRTASIMLMQVAATGEHYRERVRNLEQAFGAI
jgi:hypothetical protein